MSDKLDVAVAFGSPRAVIAADGSTRVTVSTDGERADATFAARIHRPGVVRDALLAMGDVLASDLRRPYRLLTGVKPLATDTVSPAATHATDPKDSTRP